MIVALFGIFRGLVPKILESFENRLADKDAVLSQQKQALDETCRERREQTENFLKSLNDVVLHNATSMTALTNTLESFQKKMADDHSEQHQNHRDILDLLHEQKKKPKPRAASRKI